MTTGPEQSARDAIYQSYWTVHKHQGMTTEESVQRAAKWHGVSTALVREIIARKETAIG